MLAKFLLISVLLVSSVFSSDTDKFINLFKNIKTPEQLHFAQYHVAKGYFIANKYSTAGFENGYSDNFSKEMFLTFMKMSETKNLTHGMLENSELASQICGPHGPCFDPGDAGNHP